MLKPHLTPLLGQIMFPILVFTETDNELFEEDPIEYMKNEFGELLFS